MKSRLINEYILLHKNKQERTLAYFCGMRVTGLEPARGCPLEPNQRLNLARLPIPPHPHVNCEINIL